MKNKRNARKLVLNRSTVRTLTESQVRQAAGGINHGTCDPEDSCISCFVSCLFACV